MARIAGLDLPKHKRIDVALRVVDYLEEKGYVAVVTRDLKGNHTLQLTESGARLLA